MVLNFFFWKGDKVAPEARGIRALPLSSSQKPFSQALIALLITKRRA